MKIFYSLYYDFLKKPEILQSHILDIFESYKDRRQLYFANSDMPYKKGAGGMTYDLPPLPLSYKMKELLIQLHLFTGYSYDTIFINRYPNGSYKLGWHADDSPEMDQTRPICILSLGETRKIEIEDEMSDVVNDSYDLPPGSLFLMRPGMQERFLHRIIDEPEKKNERISLTIRGYIK